MEGFADMVLDNAINGYPAIVIYREKDNSPVGWYTQMAPRTAMANLVVKQEFRGQGLGKYLIYKLAKEVLARDGFAFLYIAQDNTRSIRLHEEAGIYNCWKCVLLTLALIISVKHLLKRYNA